MNNEKIARQLIDLAKDLTGQRQVDASIPDFQFRDLESAINKRLKTLERRQKKMWDDGDGWEPVWARKLEERVKDLENQRR